MPPPPVRVTLPVRMLAPATLRMAPEIAPPAPAPVVVKALPTANASLRLRTSEPPLVMLTAPVPRLPVVDPLPTCKAPAETVVVPV